jgi:hypothetical protein
MNLIEKKSLHRIKRSADQISSTDDISENGSTLLTLSKRIFFHHYQSIYKKSSISLYETRTYQHHIHPNIQVTPHFIRDDGVVIYLEIYQNGLPIQEVSENIIHLTMEILKIKTASIYRIELKPKTKLKSIYDMNFKQLAKTYSISSEIVKYDTKIVKAYLSSMTKKRFKTDEVSEDEFANKSQIVRTSIKGFDRKEWVSATKTRNYALNDTLIDYLDLYKGKNVNQFVSHKQFKDENVDENADEIQEEPSETNEMEVCLESPIQRPSPERKILKIKRTKIPPKQPILSSVSTKPELDTPDSFPGYLMNKGIQFEADVIKLIKSKVRKNEFIEICSSMKNYYNRVLEYEASTIREIKKGTPIIYQAVLVNRTGPLAYSYGMPDLLVRTDFIDKFIDLDPLDAPNISVSITPQSPPQLNSKPYHYVVIDIKYTTLELCSDGLRIRNSGNFPAYKCQLYIYNSALGQIQGYEPGVAYILGRKYKYESQGTNFYGNNCFSRLGHIQYNSWDNSYIDDAIGAIRWIRKLRSEGSTWKLYPKPSVEELYPNMCANQDSHWHSFKETYANKIGEITLVWNCGIANRLEAFGNNVSSFRDPNCTSKNLGINGALQGPIVDSILKINQRKKFKENLDKIYIKLNSQINNNWMKEDNPVVTKRKKNTTRLQLSVDFETISNMFDDSKKLPESSENSYLFMIGLSYKVVKGPDSFSSVEAKYKMFLLSELSVSAEFQLVWQFYKFVRELTDQHLGSKSDIPSLYHWGHAEQTSFTELCSKIRRVIGPDVNHDLDIAEYGLNFYDLSECFKRNPIVINGCFKFGLKEISKRLYELKLIKTTWGKDNICAHGNTAMVLSHKAYKQSEKTGVPIIDIPIIKNIMTYNRTDCFVIHDILDVLIKKAYEQKLIK